MSCGTWWFILGVALIVVTALRHVGVPSIAGFIVAA